MGYARQSAALVSMAVTLAGLTASCWADEPTRWAVVVGINDYEDRDVQDLRYAVADATALHGVLTAAETGGFDPRRAKLLTDESAIPPTRRNMLRALGGLETAPTPEDTVLLYFSGHGFTEDGENFLLPTDGEIGLLQDTAIPLQRFMLTLKRCQAKKQIVVLDCCHSGVSRSRAVDGAMDEGFARRVFEEAEGRIVLSSCDLDEVAYEWPEKGHGVFTYHLLEALRGGGDANGDGRVTVDESIVATTAGVRDWAFNNNRRQSPRREYYRVSGDIVLTHTDPRHRPTGAAGPRRASMTLSDTDVFAVLRALEAHFGTKITAKEVPGVKVALALEDGTVEEALELICGQHDLVWEREGDTYVIKPKRGPGQQGITLISNLGQSGPPWEPGVTPSGLGWGPDDRPYPDKIVVNPRDGAEMVWIPGGTFTMGSDEHGPPHEVSIAGFWLYRHEVTNRQFRLFLPEHSSHDYEGKTLDGDVQPAAFITWHGAQAYCEWAAVRLPTEAEWEYACRAGTTTRHHWGDDDGALHEHANVADTGFAEIMGEGYRQEYGVDWVHPQSDGWPASAPVGRFPPNTFGLCDMIGNVCEWCSDWFDERYYGESPSDNPQGPPQGERRVLRGGGWLRYLDSARPDTRAKYPPEAKSPGTGFRCAALGL